MQKVVLVFMLMLLKMSVFAQYDSDKLLGKWVNEDKSRVIEFVKNGTFYEAVIRKAKDKELIGKKQITGLKAKSDGTSFVGGTLHLIKKGETANCSVEFSGSEKLVITAKSYGITKSQTWTRL